MDRHRRKKDDRRRRKNFLLPTFLPIEQLNVHDVRQWQAGQQKLLDFYSQWYMELARQRSKSVDAINRALREASVPYEFSDWRRSLRYKWSMDPLSSKGSLKVPGGRFNIGDIDERLFPKFPALYLAEDSDTALFEMIGPRQNPLEKLNQFDLALTEEKSLSIVATYGELESVIDLSNPKCLHEFVEVVKGFRVSEGLMKMGREVNIDLNEGTTKSVDILMATFMNTNWRQFPMHVDMPANSQIFGQLVYGAGIEGVLYPSKYTNKNCLAIFPQNIKGGDSFVEVIDDVPKGVLKRLDSKTWDKLI
jgi:RES domain-containing protein